jgi:hypothetical protein
LTLSFVVDAGRKAFHVKYVKKAHRVRALSSCPKLTIGISLSSERACHVKTPCGILSNYHFIKTYEFPVLNGYLKWHQITGGYQGGYKKFK